MPKAKPPRTLWPEILARAINALRSVNAQFIEEVKDDDPEIVTRLIRTKLAYGAVPDITLAVSDAGQLYLLLTDVTRLTGPERSKLRDFLTFYVRENGAPNA